MSKPARLAKGFKLDGIWITQREGSQDGVTSQSSGWRPFYLRRRILLTFVVIFCGIIAALEVLNRISQVNYGIASSVEGRHYLWTYGPTAILTMVAAFWSRVEFQVKQHAPWQSLQEKPEVAERSILLDYITPMQPFAAIQALRNRHFAVAAGATGSMLLTLLIIFSTGLFSLQEIGVQKDHVPILLYDYFSGENPTLDAEGATPFDTLNSVLFDNGSYPEGTTANLAFQRFSAPNISSNAIVTAQIDGMEAQLSCEPANITITKWEVEGVTSTYGEFTITHQNMTNEIATPSCKIENFSIDGGYGAYYPYVGMFEQGQCVGSKGTDGTRVVVTIAKIRENVVFSNDTYDDYTRGYHQKSDIVLDQSVLLICTPTYSLLEVNATNNASVSLSNVQIEDTRSKNSTLPGLAAWDIANSVLSGPKGHTIGRPIEDNNPFVAPDKMSVDYSLQIGAWLAGSTGNIDLLFQDDVLNYVASAYYRAMAAQYMNNGLARQRSSTTTGSAVVLEHRVIMAELPLRAMEVCLALGIMLALVIIFLASPTATASTPWNPNSISAIAAIISNSKSLRQYVAGTSTSPLYILEDRLKESRYCSRTSAEGFSIETVDNDQSDISTTDKQSSPSSSAGSKPFPSFIFRVAIFVAVASILVVLEVLLHISETRDGLADVTTNKYMHYSWTLLPSLLMEIIGLSFRSMSFNSRILAPYARLKRPSGAVFQSCMPVNFLDSLSVTTVIRSIRTRHFAVLAATLAAFITSFLSIVTSGLFSAMDTSQYISTNFSQEDTFHRFAIWNASVSPDLDNSNVITAQYIIQGNRTSFPRWTYERLIFPKLSMNASLRTNLPESSFVELWVPALRTAPTCLVQRGSEVNYTLQAATDEQTSVNSKVSQVLYIEPPRIGCAPWSNGTGWQENSGDLLELETEGYFGLAILSPCYNANSSGANLPVSYFWGEVRNGKVANIAAMTCAPVAETVNTWTRFQLPDFDIPADHPPVPDESSASTVKDQYIPYSPWSSTSSTAANLDSFFQALVSGRWAIPRDYLGDADKIENVIEAIKFQDGIMKAQEFNGMTRLANASLGVSLPGNVTLTNNRLRLIQDATSTRVLDALLVSILILGIIGSILVNTDHILPKSPSSIAAVASLLADSNFLDWYQPAEDPNDTARGRKFFAGSRFVLGRQNAENLSDSSSSPTEEKRDADLTICLVDPVGEKESSSIPLMPLAIGERNG
ncbi:hypothetical protein ABOM_004034 [Aspergillus bombycis]|uniref:Uncharacterized protein n=1 Tax=Aspergillus bombycis TaxID=109264 RepID=A0A1F8AC24_9EURO|nr:hypothetical protein ABOM_004034 [Aspergillus bombycis]OGM49207.1 hypothetical protein ABOM_004034 [Aspergillus bombycis]